MKNTLVPALIAAGLIIVIAVVFKSILGKATDVVPLYLVPAFFYIGYLTSKSTKIWLSSTVAITAALAVLYALP